MSGAVLMMGEKRVGIFIGSVLAAIVAGGAVFTALSDDGDGLPSRPETKTVALRPNYKSLESMTASAPLVVLARVTSVKPGLLISPPGEGSLQMRESTLEVQEVLYSSKGESPATVVIGETGWVDGVPTEDIERPWTKKGDYGYFFLRQDPVHKIYGLIGTQARVLIDEPSQQMRPSGDHHEDPFVVKLGKMTPQDFAKAVKSAATLAKEGKTKPRPLGDALPEVPVDELPPGLRP